MRGVWVPYDESIEQIIREDFQRLWATGFLDDIKLEYHDYTFSNGVVGRLVTYNLEERQRIRTIDYVGSKQVERTKIEERLKEMRTELRLDSFIDPAVLKKVEGVVREMLKEKGFQFSSVTHTITEVAGGPKLVNLIFNLDEGPKVKIRTIGFDGNQVASDRALRRRMKTNKNRKFLPFFTSHGTYQEAKFEEDADRVMQYYLDRGYINAQVGTPELKFVDNPSNKKTRWVDVQIPGAGREPLPDREPRFRRQHHREDRGAEAAVQAEVRRILQPQGNHQGIPEGAGNVRRGGLHGVHRLSGAEAARRAESRRSRRRRPRSPPNRRSPPGRRSSTSRSGCRKASSTSSTASCSSATPPRATA